MRYPVFEPNISTYQDIVNSGRLQAGPKTETPDVR
jgi:hypothetical protein